MANGDGRREWIKGRAAARWLRLPLFAQGTGCAAVPRSRCRRVHFFRVARGPLPRSHAPLCGRLRASIFPNGHQLARFEHVTEESFA
jgi:hypothetical protein